jgi:DNA-binding NarL/FixJ family response regulator
VRNCILIADDSPSVRRAVRSMFEREGWEVCGEAKTGREAIEKAQESRPTVIVLDLAMPEMDGLSAAAVLRQILPETKLVLFTMYGDSITAGMAESAGISAVVNKTSATTLLQTAVKLAGT